MPVALHEPSTCPAIMKCVPVIPKVVLLHWKMRCCLIQAAAAMGTTDEARRPALASAVHVLAAE